MTTQDRLTPEEIVALVYGLEHVEKEKDPEAETQTKRTQTGEWIVALFFVIPFVAFLICELWNVFLFWFLGG